MYTRVKSALIGILLLAFVIKIGGWVFTASVCLLNLIALWELNEAFKKIDINTALVKSMVLATFLQFTANVSNAMLVPLFIILTIITLFLHNIVNDSKNHISDAIFSVFAFVYTSLPFMYWIYIRNLPQGVNLIWWVFVVTWASDTGAYFVGNIFGKTKLAPNISPNKTVEGSIGGLAFSYDAYKGCCSAGHYSWSSSSGRGFVRFTAKAILQHQRLFQHYTRAWWHFRQI